MSSLADMLHRLCYRHLGRSRPRRNLNASFYLSSMASIPTYTRLSVPRTRVSRLKNSDINYQLQGPRSSLRTPPALAPHGTLYGRMAFPMIRLLSSIRRQYQMSILSLQLDNWYNLGPVKGRITKQPPSNQARQSQASPFCHFPVEQLVIWWSSLTYANLIFNVFFSRQTQGKHNCSQR